MNALLLPYIFNILVLLPIGLPLLFGGPVAVRRVFQAKFTDSEGIRTILGSLWTAILVGSVVGLCFPVAMSPLLLVQIIYKSLWLLVFVPPRLFLGRRNEVPWGVAGTFLFIVMTYPWVIPWRVLFGG